MNKIYQSAFIKKTIRNEQGIALLMVMGVIAILTFLLADFTFETKLNKIKIYNQQDKIQARLNAESGLNFSLGKLRLYQEGRNKIEKDENLKNAFPSSDLESIILQPFIFPIPLSEKANIIQRTAVNDFLKNIIFKGELAITYSKISGFLNPNGLRIMPKVETNKKAEADNTPENDPNDPSADPPPAQNKEEKAPAEPAWAIIEKKMIETLDHLIKDKNDNDEAFHVRYSNIEATYLIKELSYFVNNKGAFQDPLVPEIESKFRQKNITPKFSPLSSIDELYLLPSWDDAIVDLIKNQFSVHEVSFISINEITTSDLKILFPNINEIQIEEFFKYRDGDEDKKIKGKKFKSAEDFKQVITGVLNIASESEYTDRINNLKNAGLEIGTAGKLYKVTSRGSMNNAIYNLVAFIDLPIKPQPKKIIAKGSPPPSQPADGATSEDAQKDKAVPAELMIPRIIEIRLE